MRKLFLSSIFLTTTCIDIGLSMEVESSKESNEFVDNNCNNDKKKSFRLYKGQCNVYNFDNAKVAFLTNKGNLACVYSIKNAIKCGCRKGYKGYQSYKTILGTIYEKDHPLLTSLIYSVLHCIENDIPNIFNVSIKGGFLNSNKNIFSNLKNNGMEKVISAFFKGKYDKNNDEYEKYKHKIESLIKELIEKSATKRSLKKIKQENNKNDAGYTKYTKGIVIKKHPYYKANLELSVGVTGQSYGTVVYSKIKKLFFPSCNDNNNKNESIVLKNFDNFLNYDCLNNSEKIIKKIKKNNENYDNSIENKNIVKKYKFKRSTIILSERMSRFALNCFYKESHTLATSLFYSLSFIFAKKDKDIINRIKDLEFWKEKFNSMQNIQKLENIINNIAFNEEQKVDIDSYKDFIKKWINSEFKYKIECKYKGIKILEEGEDHFFNKELLVFKGRQDKAKSYYKVIFDRKNKMFFPISCKKSEKFKINVDNNCDKLKTYELSNVKYAFLPSSSLYFNYKNNSIAGIFYKESHPTLTSLIYSVLYSKEKDINLFDVINTSIENGLNCKKLNKQMSIFDNLTNDNMEKVITYFFKETPKNINEDHKAKIEELIRALFYKDGYELIILSCESNSAKIALTINNNKDHKHEKYIYIVYDYSKNLFFPLNKENIKERTIEIENFNDIESSDKSDELYIKLEEPNIISQSHIEAPNELGEYYINLMEPNIINQSNLDKERDLFLEKNLFCNDYVEYKRNLLEIENQYLRNKDMIFNIYYTKVQNNACNVVSIVNTLNSFDVSNNVVPTLNVFNAHIYNTEAFNDSAFKAPNKEIKEEEKEQ